MDPVVDFNLDSLKSSGDDEKADTVDSSITSFRLDSEKDFEHRTLVPHRDIEIHAIQTPTYEKNVETNCNAKPELHIPSASLATMESLEYSIVEGSNFFDRKILLK